MYVCAAVCVCPMCTIPCTQGTLDTPLNYTCKENAAKIDEVLR